MLGRLIDQIAILLFGQFTPARIPVRWPRLPVGGLIRPRR